MHTFTIVLSVQKLLFTQIFVPVVITVIVAKDASTLTVAKSAST